MVTSAMGDATDDLIDLARQITDSPPAREMDMLLSTGEQVSVALMAMAISELGEEAVSLTGAQIGIRTDSTHTKARIKSISTERLKQALGQRKIVIAAGFQGIDEHFNITTLGRGGSDTTAVALAAVLDADECEIYTDVDGVYTTDPRILPEARKMAQVSYDEMLELASLGAGVMHNRSIEFGKKFGVPIHVRNSFADVPGTLIVREPESPKRPVTGCALVKNEARVTVLGVPDRPGVSLAIFSRIARRNVTVDMIVQNVGAHGKANISFTVLKDELPVTLEAVKEACAELGADGLTHDDQVSKISAVGLGMARQTGVATKMFRCLSDAGVNIQMITTSEIKISVLVAREQALAGLRAVHRTFELEKPPTDVNPRASSRRSRTSAVDVVRRLQGMEDLAIDDISLDESQARVTIGNLPDAPGASATLFEQVSQAGIFVDMIIQSSSIEGRADVSFTVPRSDLPRAIEQAQTVCEKLGAGPVSASPNVAKLSVSGIGLRSQTSVAIKMFESLAQEGINVELINTSEVRVNVIVQGHEGARGLAALKKAFSAAAP
ncbi:MAG: aspartate kinase [Planctomycetia bacterium]|nr:aspartate kinase [Planctomycetia bacterium]